MLVVLKILKKIVSAIKKRTEKKLVLPQLQIKSKILHDHENKIKTQNKMVKRQKSHSNPF